VIFKRFNSSLKAQKKELKSYHLCHNGSGPLIASGIVMKRALANLQGEQNPTSDAIKGLLRLFVQAVGSG